MLKYTQRMILYPYVKLFKDVVGDNNGWQSPLPSRCTSDNILSAKESSGWSDPIFTGFKFDRTWVWGTRTPICIAAAPTYHCSEASRRYSSWIHFLSTGTPGQSNTQNGKNVVNLVLQSGVTTHLINFSYVCLRVVKISNINFFLTSLYITLLFKFIAKMGYSAFWRNVMNGKIKILGKIFILNCKIIQITCLYLYL